MISTQLSDFIPYAASAPLNLVASGPNGAAGEGPSSSKSSRVSGMIADNIWEWVVEEEEDRPDGT